MQTNGFILSEHFQQTSEKKKKKERKFDETLNFSWLYDFRKS